jgi:hypothetical protein
MSICSRCKASFSCGMADDATDQPCWCVALPALPGSAIKSGQEDGAASCLCPDCLKARIEEAKRGIG